MAQFEKLDFVIKSKILSESNRTDFPPFLLNTSLYRNQPIRTVYVKMGRKKELKPEKTVDQEFPLLIEGLRRISQTLAKHSNKIDSIYEEELPKISSAIERLIEKLDKIEERLEKIEERVREKEEVIVVREITFDEAKKMVEDYLSSKKGEIVTPLELADTLQIPYETAHEIFLQLIKEGKLKIKDIDDY